MSAFIQPYQKDSVNRHHDPGDLDRYAHVLKNAGDNDGETGDAAYYEFAGDKEIVDCGRTYHQTQSHYY